MRKFIHILLSAILLFCSLTIIIPEKTYACSCAVNSDPNKAIEEAEAVFSGKVLNIKQGREQNGIVGAIEYRDVNLFEVQETWKGINQSQVMVYDNGGDASCGVNFEESKSYLVYTYKNKEGDLYTSLCSRTAEISKAGEDLTILGQGKPADKVLNLKGEMRKISNRDYDMEIFIGGFVVALALVIFLFIRAKRKG